MEDIDLKDLFNYFKKKIPLFLAITTLIVALGSVYSLFLQQPIYQSRATIILGSNKSNPITHNEVNINKNLVDTYSQVVKSRRVLDKVLDKLSLDYSYEKLLRQISVSSIKNTEIIEITVLNPEPARAKDVANATAEFFTQEISGLYNVENVNVLDYAIEPHLPHNIDPLRQGIIYLAIGIFLGFAVIFIVYYFDRTIKTAEQIEHHIKLPLIGKIRKYTPKTEEQDELILKSDPKSRISEDFRTLRTNLHFSLNGKETKTLLVTSSVPNEGKSFTTSNLALAFAKTGKKVLLIDCDMRLGRLHEIFKVANTKGLSNLLADHKSSKYPDYICRTKVANLGLIPRGAVPPNPSELLDSPDMERLLAKTRMQYDYIILDGTPIDDLSDSLILAKKVDRVVTVCSSGTTSIEDLQSTKKALTNINANIAGVIINKVADRKSDSKYNKYYQ